MRIAIDARHLHNHHHSSHYSFTKEIIEALTEQKPNVHFILLLDSPVVAAMKFPSNVSCMVLTPPPKSLLSFKWWYDMKVPAALKKSKADVFIGTYGLASLRSDGPQILLVNDVSFLVNTAFFLEEGKAFYKHYTSLFLKKAQAIATPSEFIKQQLQVGFQIDGAKITVIPPAVENLYQPASYEQKEKTKAEYTAGCEYFVFNDELCERTNVLNLLKAFSLFKKWQKTNMKLVLSGNVHATFRHEMAKLETYKYRNDVVVLTHLSTGKKASVVGAAYALVSPSLYDGFAKPVLEALQCETPVVAAASGSGKEIAVEAALYADASNVEEIATQLKRLFKDEVLRNKLIEEGKMRVKQFTWKNSAELLCELIEKTVSA